MTTCKIASDAKRSCFLEVLSRSPFSEFEQTGPHKQAACGSNKETGNKEMEQKQHSRCAARGNMMCVRIKTSWGTGIASGGSYDASVGWKG